MNSEQLTSNNEIELGCSINRIELPDKFFLPEEQVLEDTVPFDDEPSITIEYFEGQLHPPNPVRISGEKRCIKVYHPFTNYVEELPESSLSSLDSLIQYLASETANKEKPVEEERNIDGEVLVLSGDDSPLQDCVDRQASTVTDELGRTLALRQLRELEQNKIRKSNTRKGFEVGTQTVSINDDVICVEDDSPDLSMKEIAEQMRQKMAERLRATNDLRQKKTAETNLAKQLVRQIMHPGKQVQNFTHVSSARGAGSCLGQRYDQMSPKERREAGWAETAWARRLIKQLSRGYSVEQVIQELKSAPPNSRPTSPPAKQVLRQNPSGDEGTQSPSSHPQLPASPVQPKLPSYTQAFNRPGCYNQSTTRGGLEEPVQGEIIFSVPEQRSQVPQQRFPEYEQRFQVPEQGFSVIQPAFIFPYPSYSLPTIENQPSRTRKGSSLLSAVHPSHLLPPCTVVVNEGQDFISPEVSNIFDQTNPLNENFSADTSGVIRPQRYENTEYLPP